MNRETGRGGFALISVLWIVVLVAVVGLDFSLRARGLTRRVINHADYSIARAAAEGSIVHARDRLVARLRETGARSPDVTPLLDPWQDPAALLGDSLLMGQAGCTLTLEDLGHRLHLNVAGEDELRRTMSAAGMDSGDADRLAQAIADWKDLDEFRRARGAEREEYVRTDAPALPANGPFGSVDELVDVRGVTPEVYARLRPLLTIAGSGRVNLSSAPAEVIYGLPGMTDQLLELVLESRGRGRTPDLLTLPVDVDEDARAELNRNLALLMSRVVTTTEEVLITSVCSVAGSAVAATMTAVAVRAREAVYIVERSVR